MKIKFLNLNIWHGGKLFSSVGNFINKESPDILALQEVQETSGKTSKKQFKTYSLFKKLLPYNFSFFDPLFSFYQGKLKIDHGNAIFSRYPIKNHKVYFFDLKYAVVDWDSAHKLNRFEHFPRNMQWVQLKINNKLLNIFNLHGIWGKDGKDNSRRLKMSDIIVDKVKNKEKVILSGDFNMDPNTKTIQNIEKVLKNVFKNKLKSTFNIKYKKDPVFSKIVVDMIFISHDIKIVGKRCPQVDISDHLPLIAVFEI